MAGALGLGFRLLDVEAPREEMGAEIVNMIWTCLVIFRTESET